MRILFSIASFALLAGTASAQQYSHEKNTYRYGGTYSKVQTNSATSCAALCSRESVCRSWSFQRATRGLGPATCELKAVVGKSVKNPLMTSGINPLLARQGQNSVRSAPVQHNGTLLGGVTGTPARTVIRNQNVRSLPAAPRPLAPTQTFRPAPTPAPAPVIQAPVVQPAPIVRRAAPAPRPALPAAPRPAPVVQAPVVQPAPIVRRAAPAPRPPAPPVTSRTSTLPPPPGVANERIQVPVTQGDLPDGAVFRTAPPPQISFAPPAALPAPAGTIVSSPPVAPNFPSVTTPPTPAPVPSATRETITLPKSTRTKSEPKLLNTVPAGSVPAAAPNPNKPYENLGSSEFPDFSVNNNTVLTPDQYEAQIAAEAAAASKAVNEPTSLVQEGDQLFETLDSVNLDGTDLATDVGAPLAPPNQRRPGSTGSTARGGGS